MDSACLKQSRILVVDDEPHVLLLLKKILEREGFSQVITTSHPEEVRRLYLEHRPDAVILDLKLPGKSGWEILEELRAVESEESWVPVLALTGDLGDDVRLRTLRMGARDFLQKPFTAQEAIVKVTNLLELRVVHRRNLEARNILVREVEDAHLEVVRRLTMAAEYRDDDTGNHINRISHYCVVLGQAMGMDQHTVDLLSHASAMHDVGKIGIPDHILLKPGKLTPEEWEIMKSHTEIGARLLSGSRHELLQMAEVIARTHHEKWDGSGYPRGLAGEAIPLLGRLVAVCDVFDALTSERPYKKAWPVEDAVAEIQRSSGKHFDPAVVQVFMQNLNRLLEIKRTFATPGGPEGRVNRSAA